VIDGLRVSWDEGPESDLAGYEVADTGDVTPSADGDVTDAQVIAIVQPNPGSSNRALYDFREELYTGNSNGTVITLSAAAGARYFPSGAHVVGGTGKNVQMWNSSDVESNHQVVSNTEKTITFAASSIPTGELRLYIRGSNGRHTFYVRPFDSSQNKATWKPVPPTVQWCFPRAIDGSKDIGLPATPWGDGSAPGTTICWFSVHGVGGSAARPGYIYVFIAVRGADEAETDFDLALKQNINGLTECEVEVTHSDDGETSLGTTVFPCALSNERDHYVHQVSGGSRWVYSSSLPMLYLPGQGIDDVRVRVRNAYGWSAWNGIVGLWGPPGAKPWFTGSGALQVQAQQGPKPATNDIYPNLSETFQFKIDSDDVGLSGNPTVKPPEYRSKSATHGSGNAPQVGEIFTVKWEQGTTPRRIIWDAAYKGVSDTAYPPSMMQNTTTIYTFLVETTSSFQLISYLPPDG